MKFIAEDDWRRVLSPELAQGTPLPRDFDSSIDKYAPKKFVRPSVVRVWNPQDAAFAPVLAIKAYRQATGCGLKEAKETVEFFVCQGYTWTTVTHE